MNLKTKYYLLSIISILYIPLSFVLANYIVFFSVVCINYLHNTNEAFKSVKYTYHILSIFGLLIMIYIYYIANIIIKISSQILKLSKDIDLINDQENILKVLPTSDKKAEIKVLYHSVNNLITRLKENQIKRRDLEDIHYIYLSQISHDIKTPLSLIRISLYYIENNMDSEEAINDIKYNIKVIENLSNQIEIKNKSNAFHNKDIDYSDINLIRFFNLILLKWNNILRQKMNILIDVDHSINILSNFIWLERLIDNIIQNSVFHSDAKNIKISAKNENNKTKIIISDDGKGFDYHKMISKSSKYKDKGIYIINDISSLLKFELEYVTAPGRGTKVILTHNRLD